MRKARKSRVMAGKHAHDRRLINLLKSMSQRNEPIPEAEPPERIVVLNVPPVDLKDVLNEIRDNRPAGSASNQDQRECHLYIYLKNHHLYLAMRFLYLLMDHFYGSVQ